jgi:hypothetical protein
VSSSSRYRLSPPLLLLLVALLPVGGCEDLRQFSGPWTGTISRDPNHQHGFARDATLSLTVGGVTRYGLDMTVTLPGATGTSRFEPMRHAVQDVLADLRLPGDPLRTYLGFVRTGAAGGAQPPEAPAPPLSTEPYLAVVSLYAEERIEVRLIRGPDADYGVFMLARPDGEAGAD